MQRLNDHAAEQNKADQKASNEKQNPSCTSHPHLTLGGMLSLVKAMKISEKQILRMARAIFKGLKEQKVIEFKEKEEVALERAAAIIRADFAREIELDREVNRMMDDLERQNPGEFQRFKMFPMLKKRLAKEKGIIL